MSGQGKGRGLLMNTYVAVFYMFSRPQFPMMLVFIRQDLEMLDTIPEHQDKAVVSQLVRQGGERGGKEWFT